MCNDVKTGAAASNHPPSSSDSGTSTCGKFSGKCRPSSGTRKTTPAPQKTGKRGVRSVCTPGSRLAPAGRPQPCPCTWDALDSRLSQTCSRCSTHFHPACEGLYTRTPGGPLYCAPCAERYLEVTRLSNSTSAQAAATCASSLPQTDLSRHLEHVAAQHEQEQQQQGSPGTPGLSVRQVEDRRAVHELTPKVCKAYLDDKETHSQLEALRTEEGKNPEVPGRRVALMLFQKLPGDAAAIPLLYIQVTEFGDDAPAAFRGTITLDWLDSTTLLRTDAGVAASGKHRSMLYQELLVAYFTLRQQQGFRMVLIDACAPSSTHANHSYIFRRQRPEPRIGDSPLEDAAQDRLLEFYQRMASTLVARGVVVAPPPRADQQSRFRTDKVAQHLWETQDTLGRLADEQLQAATFNLHGVAIFETVLLKETEVALAPATAAAATGVSHQIPAPGSRKRGRTDGASAEAVVRAWAEIETMQCNMLILRLEPPCYGQDGPPHKARCTAGERVSAAPESTALLPRPQQEDLTAWAPSGKSIVDLLTNYDLRFDTLELASHAMRQLLLWIQPQDDPSEDTETDAESVLDFGCADTVPVPQADGGGEREGLNAQGGRPPQDLFSLSDVTVPQPDLFAEPPAFTMSEPLVADDLLPAGSGGGWEVDGFGAWGCRGLEAEAWAGHDAGSWDWPRADLLDLY